MKSGETVVKRAHENVGPGGTGIETAINEIAFVGFGIGGAENDLGFASDIVEVDDGVHVVGAVAHVPEIGAKNVSGSRFEQDGAAVHADGRTTG